MKYSRPFQIFAITMISIYYKTLYRVKVIGRENIPKEGCLITANHPSAHDPLLIITCVGVKHAMTSMGKKELFNNKILGFFIYKLGGFPVDRGKSDIKAIKQCITSIKDGMKLIIFPEGTRTIRSGKKAKAGVGLIALKTNCKILPCYMPEKLQIFKKNIVIIGKPIDPPVEKISTEIFAQNILDLSFELGVQYENHGC